MKIYSTKNIRNLKFQKCKHTTRNAVHPFFVNVTFVSFTHLQRQNGRKQGDEQDMEYSFLQIIWMVNIS